MQAENPLLQFEPGLMLWTIVVFALTLFVLTKIAWKPLMRILDEREKRIRDALTKAETAQREAEEAIAQARRETAEALRRADDFVKQTRNEAGQLRQKIIDEAKAESQKVVDQGMRRIEAEQRMAMQEIRKAAAGLAIQAANRLIRHSMDEAKQREIVEQFLAELPEDRVQ